MKYLSLTLSLFLFWGCSKDDNFKSAPAPCPTTNIFEDKDILSVSERYIFVLEEAFTPLLPNDYNTSRTALKSTIESLIPSNLLEQITITNIYTQVFKGFAIEGPSRIIAPLTSLGIFKNIEPDNGIQLYQNCFSPPTQKPTQSPSWGAERIGTKSGEGKRAWIFDTGIDPNHEDLQVNELLSRDFADGTLLPSDIISFSGWQDVNGHGTHVAGIIGAKDNNIGTIGIASGCDLVAIKVLNNKGQGNASDLIEAIDYVASIALPGEVANMSLGGSANILVDIAVMRLASKNIQIAIAAGNNSNDASNYSPARVNHKNVYTISAFSKGDDFAYYSNYGNPTIEYSQPGSNIISTWTGNSYILASGTSMAAPHFAGLLLTNGKDFNVDGAVNNDPDGFSDLIAVQGN